ncbi:MAG TPA: PQQ-dependent sugar dehydrogenase, partial [Verrucomicrobiae bacterium]|nr:PQQ-dependent sugar dehydrogenase [Verrucomicrobiae bacterium]
MKTRSSSRRLFGWLRITIAFLIFFSGVWGALFGAAKQFNSARFLGRATAAPLKGAKAPRPSGAFPTIDLEAVVPSGLTNPVAIANAGDGTGRLFIVEQPGLIRIVIGGNLLATPFLDISDLVSCCGEQGLLGLAFHPGYVDNGFFYVDYTDVNGNTVVARYTVSANDPNVADPNSAHVILTQQQPFPNHNGGQVVFGPDGYLYIAFGDGGGGGDPQENGQNLQTW